jgi:Ca-activated chloride channel family protein
MKPEFLVTTSEKELKTPEAGPASVDLASGWPTRIPGLPDQSGRLTFGLVTIVIGTMRSPRVTDVRPVFGAVCYLALALPAAIYSQDCQGPLLDDEIVGGVACPDGSAATVIPSDRELPPARPARPLEEVSAEPPDVPYNEDTFAGLETVSEAGSGSTFSVVWTGPGNHRDYLAVAAPDDPGNRQLTYAYVELGSPLQLTAPDEPGDYEVRYVQRQSRVILARQPITVLPVAATLQLASEVNSGSIVDVGWSGPANHRDYLAIAVPDDPGNRQLSYAYVERGSPLALTAPDEPGDYEVRYIQRQSRVILAREPITVLPVVAALEHPSEMGSGSIIEVAWSGPANPRDYLAIAAPDDPGGRQHNYAYVERGSPLALTAPDEPGDYEVRYIQRQSRIILARQPIIVLPVTATIQAARVVNTGSPFDVTWTGPANSRDYLAIAEAGDPGNRQLTYAYVEKGSPLALTAPDEPGNYEVRYIQRQSRNILARYPIEVRD